MITQKEENRSEQDIIVQTQALNGRQDIGHVISGEQVRKWITKIADFFKSAWLWIVSWWECHKQLTVSYNKYNKEGEIIDTLTRTWEVRRIYSLGPKYISFKTFEGNKVELKTATPMDYMTEEL